MDKVITQKQHVNNDKQTQANPSDTLQIFKTCCIQHVKH